MDRNYRALHLSPKAGRFLLQSAGPVTTDVVDMVRPELRLDLRSAVRRALDHGEPTLTMPVTVAFDDQSRRVMMQVAPVIGECPIFCVTGIWSMHSERSKDDDDDNIQRTAGRTAEGLRAA